MFLTSMS